jgi:hypothetical protein
MMHDDKRSYIYWDGAEMAALASLFADPSLNWVDPFRLAAVKLNHPVQHVWYAPSAADCRDHFARKSLHKYLQACGVDLRIVKTALHEDECHHCGQTFIDSSRSTSLALTLGLLSDAMQDRFDCAYVVTNKTTQALLRQHQSLLPHGKQVNRLIVDVAALEASRLPRLVQCGAASRIQRPSIWNKPRWINAAFETALTDSGV